MKKLLTAMLLSAGVGFAYAQSSVTVYGIFGSIQSSGNQQTTAGAGSSKNMYALGVRHTF
jgi:predicted porin